MGIVLQATTRNTGGVRSKLSKLRKQGQLPAVVYGYNIESTPIVLDYLETAKAVQKYGRTSVFQISIDGKTKVNAVLTEVQRCALKGHVKHADFLSINMSEELEVEVPVVSTGDPIGVKEGGVLTQPVRLVTIKVKPSEMPDSIELDVSGLAMGDSISVADVRSKINFEIINPDEDTLFTVTPPASANNDVAGQGDNDNQDIKASGAPESEN